MLMAMIDTPDIIKEKNLKLHSLVPVKFSTVKLASKLFGVSKRYVRIKIIKSKCIRYVIKTKLDEIFWIKKDKNKW